MAAIHAIYPNIETFAAKIKHEKIIRELTNQNLADISGVSLSTIGKLLSGNTIDPKLSDAAALCDVLGLSLDALCGLADSAQPDGQLVQRIHVLELENAELRGVARTRLESIAAQRPILYSLFAFFALSVVMAFSLFAYLIGDAMHTNVGLIQHGELSGPAWAIVFLLVAALGNTAALVWRLYKHRKE